MARECSRCGSALENEAARGGGPHNARCSDCMFDSDPTPGTVEYARKNDIPPHGDSDGESTVEVPQ